jgi:hypothetical protein
MLRFGLLPSAPLLSLNLGRVSALLDGALPTPLLHTSVLSHAVRSARRVSSEDVALAARFAVDWPDARNISAFSEIGWVVEVSVAAPGGLVTLHISPGAGQSESEGASAVPSALLTASCSYVFPIVVDRAAPGPGHDGGGGAYFSIAVLAVASEPPPSFSATDIVSRAAAGGVTMSLSAAAGPWDAAVTIPPGNEAGIVASIGSAPAGVRPYNFSGPGTVTIASLERPVSAVGYVFDVLFPATASALIVSISAGTLVAASTPCPESLTVCARSNVSAAAAAAVNAGDLWVVMPFVAPTFSLSSGTWFSVRVCRLAASFPVCRVRLFVVGFMLLQRRSSFS